MANIEIKISHSLGKLEAKRRIKNLVSGLKKTHAAQISNVSESWSGDVGTFSLAAMGYQVGGTLTVTEAHILLVVDLPWPASMFKGKIESLLKKEAQKLLN